MGEMAGMAGMSVVRPGVIDGRFAGSGHGLLSLGWWMSAAR
jgi:hypothetical protein